MFWWIYYKSFGTKLSNFLGIVVLTCMNLLQQPSWLSIYLWCIAYVICSFLLVASKLPIWGPIILTNVGLRIDTMWPLCLPEPVKCDKQETEIVRNNQVRVKIGWHNHGWDISCSHEHFTGDISSQKPNVCNIFLHTVYDGRYTILKTLC